MTLIVEDGSAKPDAESFASVADADAYLADRGYTLWATMSEAQQEQALRRATEYMEGYYGDRWGGYRATETQALAWPRVDVMATGCRGYVAPNVVPPQVRNACCALAFKAASGELARDDDPTMRVKSKTVGPLGVVYQDSASSRVKYPAIDMTLRAFLAGGSNEVRLVRA